MPSDGILYGPAEAAIINVLLWWLPVAASALPLAFAFNTKDHLNKWVHYWDSIPRMHGSVPAFLWILLNVAFGTAAGLGIWLLRDGDSFADNTVALIFNYIAMLFFSIWTVPVLLAYSKTWATVLAVIAAAAFIVLVIFAWITGPWYAGLTLTIALGALFLILLMWVMPLTGKIVVAMKERCASMKSSSCNKKGGSYRRM